MKMPFLFFIWIVGAAVFAGKIGQCEQPASLNCVLRRTTIVMVWPGTTIFGAMEYASERYR